MAQVIVAKTLPPSPKDATPMTRLITETNISSSPSVANTAAIGSSTSPTSLSTMRLPFSSRRSDSFSTQPPGRRNGPAQTGMRRLITSAAIAAMASTPAPSRNQPALASPLIVS